MPVSITSDNKVSRTPGGKQVYHLADTSQFQNFDYLKKQTPKSLIEQYLSMGYTGNAVTTMADAVQLSELRKLTVADQTSNAPVLTADPETVARAIPGADGNSYFVPQAKLAKRPRWNDPSKPDPLTPYVFFEKKDEETFYLVAWFELVRHPSVTGNPKQLPIDSFTVTLEGEAGDATIEFEEVDELPAGDKSDSVISQLFCKAKLADPAKLNQASHLMESEKGRFVVSAQVHYSLQSTPKPKPKKKKEKKKSRSKGNAYRVDQITYQNNFDRNSIGRRATSSIPHPGVAYINKRGTNNWGAHIYTTSVVEKPAAKPSARPVKKTADIKIDNGKLPTNFKENTNHNKIIYAQIHGTGIGSPPASVWAASPNGYFLEAPIPEQFYVLPDEYRLQFDPATGRPAMDVLLVPPDKTNESGPTSFSAEYKFRCRFRIVPWLDPARVERLREQLAAETNTVHPKLVMGGIQSAACQLSRFYDSLGSSLVGEADASIDVDPLGFDLVVDCTSEFYRLLTHSLVNDGIEAKVKLTLMKDIEGSIPTPSKSVLLRLDRPSASHLQAELVRAPKAEGDEKLSMPSLRITNHFPYDATVQQLTTELLVTDGSTPTPIGAVDATPSPSSFTIPAATADGPTTLEVALTPEDSSLPPFYGAADVGFIGLSLDIDPREVLDQVHDLGASAEIFSTIDIQSYQLANPESLPETHSDLFGIEAEFRRPEAAEDDAVTAFLSLDNPQAKVQVAFSVADLLEGAKPEQPKFSWRRRNMRGSGTGPWSEWEETIGRSLYIFPEGM